MSKTRPTRIIAPPHRIACPRNDKGQNISMLVFDCDNGRTYTLDELAAAALVNPNTIRTRIAAAGWDSPDVLLRGRKPKRESEGSPEWKALGSRARHQLLRHIAGPGPLESALLDCNDPG